MVPALVMVPELKSGPLSSMVPDKLLVRVISGLIAKVVPGTIVILPVVNVKLMSKATLTLALMIITSEPIGSISSLQFNGSFQLSIALALLLAC